MFRYKNTTYHAVYGHMNSISVARGDIVEQWQHVGELWNSGSTFWALGGNHVHFEINRDNGWRSAFYYHWCPAMKTNTFTEITNGGLCREYREKYSYDPVAFIESTRSWVEIAFNDIEPNRAQSITQSSSTRISSVSEDKSLPIRPSAQPLSLSFLSINTLKPQRLTRDALSFVQSQDIQLIVNYNKKMNLWQKWTISLYVTKKWSAEKFDGMIYTDVAFISPNWW
jgi:murein DD-endopeptidase MepM/ murein hydrolase activator NlpD